jgi:hypothetical protein
MTSQTEIKAALTIYRTMFFADLVIEDGFCPVVESEFKAVITAPKKCASEYARIRNTQKYAARRAQAQKDLYKEIVAFLDAS